MGIVWCAAIFKENKKLLFLHQACTKVYLTWFYCLFYSVWHVLCYYLLSNIHF